MGFVIPGPMPRDSVPNTKVLVNLAELKDMLNRGISFVITYSQLVSYKVAFPPKAQCDKYSSSTNKVAYMEEKVRSVHLQSHSEESQKRKLSKLTQ